MGKDRSKQTKKEIMEDIILKLHAGLSVEEAKERFESEVGIISSAEIADIEQTLISDGLPPEEIKKICDVPALIFQSALEQAGSEETFPSHPVYLFKSENREIKKLTNSLKDIAKKDDLSLVKAGVKEVLPKLSGIENHYERKEMLLYPFLEKQGFLELSKAMWEKDRDARDLLKMTLAKVESVSNPEELQAYTKGFLKPLIEGIEELIFEEENTLFPTSIEKLNPGDWAEILKESDAIGYAFIQKPAETEVLTKNLKAAFFEEARFQDDTILFPSGTIQLNELMYMLNTLPVGLTFVDKEDTLKYVSQVKEHVFFRSKAAVGRKVQNCHPPQSLAAIEAVLNSFKEGKKDFAEMQTDYRGRRVYIGLFAVRDHEGQYLGTVEVIQDITKIQRVPKGGEAMR